MLRRNEPNPAEVVGVDQYPIQCRYCFGLEIEDVVNPLRPESVLRRRIYKTTPATLLRLAASTQSQTILYLPSYRTIQPPAKMHVYSISTIVVLMAGLVTSAALPPPVEPKIAAGNVTSAALPAEPKITAPIIKNLIATNQGKKSSRLCEPYADVELTSGCVWLPQELQEEGRRLLQVSLWRLWRRRCYQGP
jgi:hypothetical protein